ncbi:hypothetical protein [Legionella fallonii]|uniref:Transporter suffix domain-containing protein n=1 Tax=Legionella fallonii LLAP-10 TaxID=1212491 RepID=A0A098G7I3_9GAMM|nr:hypothetical protein [Legionella fallonii]CEG58417.1 conserved membrane protein of unknown function [Legionella fallonii LLAP-10]
MNKNDDEQHETNSEDPIKIPRKKLLCGLIVFVLSFAAPLFIPAILMLGISPVLKTIISGLLVFGIPEIGMLLAVVILGKDGYLYLKTQILFWLKQTVMVNQISRTRYRIGILLFSITFIAGFLMPYVNYFSSIPMKNYHYHSIFILDFLFFISLFILGGNFWEKLKALFLYEMVVSNTKQ